MIFSWHKHKTYPDFWKNYLKKFKQKQSQKIETTTFVVFDTETTGLDIKNDRILSIGAVSISNNIIDISNSFELYLKQEKFKAETVQIHGILKEGRILKTSEKKAIQHFINYIGNSVLVAHHAAFDIEMINASLKRLHLAKLKNKTIDTGALYKKIKDTEKQHFNLDALCTEFKIPKHDRHTASGDAYITALLFLKIIAKLKKERNIHYTDLFRRNHKKGLL